MFVFLFYKATFKGRFFFAFTFDKKGKIIETILHSISIKKNF